MKKLSIIITLFMIIASSFLFLKTISSNSEKTPSKILSEKEKVIIVCKHKLQEKGQQETEENIQECIQEQVESTSILLEYLKAIKKVKNENLRYILMIIAIQCDKQTTYLGYSDSTATLQCINEKTDELLDIVKKRKELNQKKINYLNCAEIKNELL